MKALKFFALMVLILSVSGVCFADSERVNNLILGKSLSDVIYEVSGDIIENRSEVISINVSGSSDPFVVKFVSNDYAIANNISCDDGNCTLFGQYSPVSKIIYVLPETIDSYYNDSQINQTYEKISNTFIHELAHHYQHERPSFVEDMIEALSMDATFISPTNYHLNNYNDYQGFNLTDIPESIDQTIDFPDALSTYVASSYLKEIQVRIIAVCLQEKKDYSFYWDMIETKNYEVCNQYQFPYYLDNNLASDLKYFVEAYVTDYLNISTYELLFDKTLTDISFDIYEGYLEDGKDQSFVTFNGLGVLYTDSSFFTGEEIFGEYLPDENVIVINLDKITQDLQNNSEEEVRIKLENTLAHEIGHYIDHNNRVSEFRDYYNIETNNSNLTNHNYYTALWSAEFLNNVTPSDIPEVLHLSINFIDLFLNSGYARINWDEEVLVRLHALCTEEKVFYSGYSNMYQQSDYSMCGNFSGSYINELNIVGKELIEGYLFEFEPDLLSPTARSKFELSGVTSDSFSVLRIIIRQIMSVVLTLSIPIAILTSVAGFIIFLLKNFNLSITGSISRMFKKK